MVNHHVGSNLLLTFSCPTGTYGFLMYFFERLGEWWESTCAILLPLCTCLLLQAGRLAEPANEECRPTLLLFLLQAFSYWGCVNIDL